MKRRDFFRNTALAAAGSAVISPFQSVAMPTHRLLNHVAGKRAKNIIFMVSDGMSVGTLSMANMLSERREGKLCAWMSLYQEKKAVRGLMDTASANSLVTDSAAASSSWGGGVRVNNGALNVTPEGDRPVPILQKFKAAGKSVGCVTTVPITHATPAGFCVNSDSRGDQAEIALMYHDLRFDVMMGGGTEFFSADNRKDKQDVFGKFVSSDFSVVKTRDELLAADVSGKPFLGVFYPNGLPYALDREHDEALKANTPSLTEMVTAAIKRLAQNSKGFVLQIEAGKVDWSAHANDTGALIYDQLEFDRALAAVLSFAEADGETLVIVTTDHGNANPGLFGATANFEKIIDFKHTNDWVLQGIDRDFNAHQVRERIEYAQGYAINADEAVRLLAHYVTDRGEDGLYNPYKLPFADFADIQRKYTSIGWAGTGHSGDHVEVAAYGAGAELLKPFVRNTDLHYLMLEAAGVKSAQI
ncbi:alkaline phosphatase [Parapedobacter indicus]|uniref:Alkaline phosphatase n=1 Tax=Parapedobacter indicus TaxID=1477437 RepID=A0A1I3RVJ9_9SPHI|nr:alkaline phosphatase [Parapedobacter indicus]PPL00003.1 alkaline phosphatase [Parapedobacter indicus]SFJ49266.1 alkaline phosphatase [Parapedobacter indicus]